MPVKLSHSRWRLRSAIRFLYTTSQHSILFFRFFVFFFPTPAISSPCGHFFCHLFVHVRWMRFIVNVFGSDGFRIFLFRSLWLRFPRLYFHSYCRQAINDACSNLFMYVALPLNRIISPFGRFTSLFTRSSSFCLRFLCVCVCVFVGLFLSFLLSLRLVWLRCWRPKKIYENQILFEQRHGNRDFEKLCA